MSPKREVILPAQIEQSILLIRGLKVMLNSDLARFYGVTVKRLNEQVRGNLRRFPSDFMIHQIREEYDLLRSHFATLKPACGELLASRMPRNCFSFVLIFCDDLNPICRH